MQRVLLGNKNDPTKLVPFVFIEGKFVTSLVVMQLGTCKPMRVTAKMPKTHINWLIAPNGPLYSVGATSLINLGHITVNVPAHIP